MLSNVCLSMLKMLFQQMLAIYYKSLSEAHSEHARPMDFTQLGNSELIGAC